MTRVEHIGPRRLEGCPKCETCGETFWVKPYRRSKARFCSKQCSGAWHAKEFLNAGPKPHLIGNTFRAGKKPANAFTSEQVRGEANHRWQPGAEMTCEHCAKVFRQKPWLARQNGEARFCGRECFEASACFLGEKSSNWVGGPKTYRGRGWKVARAAVVVEQRGCCAECRKTVGKSLPVHHITPFRMFRSAAEANVRSNLIGLCQSCHMKHERMEAPKPAFQEALL